MSDNNLMNNEEIQPDTNKRDKDFHLKGYIYDSLVLRYQLALYKASLQDARDYMFGDGLSKNDAEAKARHNYGRDLVRFTQILNEVIGGHD